MKKKTNLKPLKKGKKEKSKMIEGSRNTMMTGGEPNFRRKTI